MSLLDKSSLIEINLYYKYAIVGKRLIILSEEKAKEQLDRDDEESVKEVEIMETKWDILTWKEQNEVMNLSSQTINPQTGERQFNFVAYRDAVVKRCLKEWNLTINGSHIPVTAEAIDNLPGSVVVNLYQKFEKMLDYTEQELGN